MVCNTDLLCCGNNNLATPQDFYFANIALLCAIRDAVITGGGGVSANSILWDTCFQYLPDGEIELVTFTRQYTLDTLTGVTTTYDFDKLTGLPVVVPEGAVLSVCPSCCDETNALLEQLLPTNPEAMWNSRSIPLADATSAVSVLGAPGEGLRFQLRYIMLSNAGDADTFQLEDDTGGVDYHVYLVTGGIFATRANKDDYITLEENQSLTLTPLGAGSSAMNINIEYRIIPYVP